MTRHEGFALNHYFAEYPDDMDYMQVLDAFLDSDYRVIVCEAYEGINEHVLVNEIGSLKYSLEREYS